MQVRRSQERFGRFVVHECLGTGGMAMVHRATIDIGTGTQREVALKRLLPGLERDPAFVRDFVREGVLAARLEHPNIVRTYELGCIGGRYYIAMELVRGVSLERLLAAARDANMRVPVEILLAILIELCEALDHASSEFRIIHRDVTPANVLITEDGHVKLVDFGIAMTLGAPPSGLVKGTLRYMAPEAAVHPDAVDTRADIYSVGVLASEMLDMTCPRSVASVVRRAAAPHRQVRWSSPGAMRDALVAITAARHVRACSLDIAAWARSMPRATAHVAGPQSSGPITRREVPRRVA
jgi:serine/threonine-protein kinase